MPHALLWYILFSTVWSFLHFFFFFLFHQQNILESFPSLYVEFYPLLSCRTHANETGLRHEVNCGEVMAATVRHLTTALGWTFQLFPAAYCNNIFAQSILSSYASTFLGETAIYRWSCWVSGPVHTVYFCSCSFF